MSESTEDKDVVQNIIDITVKALKEKNDEIERLKPWANLGMQMHAMTTTVHHPSIPLEEALQLVPDCWQRLLTEHSGLRTSVDKTKNVLIEKLKIIDELTEVIVHLQKEESTRIKKLLDAPGCERIRDFYNVGPVQRAAVESLIDAVRQS